MQVMVLEQDQNLQAHIAGALMEKGFQVICVESIGAAENFIRLDFIDVLVMGERVGGRLSHSLALLAECRNPLVSAILLTDRTGPSLEEIFDLIPSIYGILGRRISPDIVAQIVLASTVGQTTETAHSRLSSRWAEADASPSVIAIGPEVNEPEEFEPEEFGPEAFGPEAFGPEDYAEDAAYSGMAEAEVAEIVACEAELTDQVPMEMVHSDVEITVGDFADANLVGTDTDPVEVIVTREPEADVTAADVVSAPEAALPVLVLTAPQFLAVTPSAAEPVAEPLAGYAAEQWIAEPEPSLPAEESMQAVEALVVEPEPIIDAAPHPVAQAFGQPMASDIARPVSPFAPGWPLDQTRNPFGPVMADLPDFTADPFASVMPAAIARAVSPAEAADRRLHLA